MLDEEGRRCWTLIHREAAKFHLDILPAVVGSNFTILLEKSMSAGELDKVAELAIRITDKVTSNYYTSVNPYEWLKSNPFGYAAWFKLQASLSLYKSILLRESVQSVPEYEKEKLPLQVVVQILKRHRDIMFNGDEDKPISVIITTLAAKSYRKQTDTIEALIGIVNTMTSMIEDRYDPLLQRTIKWVANPVNSEENFADKWPANPKREENFYKWIRQVKADVENAVDQKGLYRIQEALSNPFGKNAVGDTFGRIGEKARVFRESGVMKMASGTGILSTTGRTNVPYHNNFGKDA